MANLYVKATPPADMNKNTEWFTYPGVWTTYILILFFAWLLVLSIFGCTPGMAWSVVNLGHFAIDSGKQLTRNRKFLTVVPVVLYLIASHTTDYQHPMLFFNTLAVMVLVVAKFPNMHKENGPPMGPERMETMIFLVSRADPGNQLGITGVL
ncbi:hypothetical protein K1719_026991 [Acacia pycnantha]|nr:hypothetical protein K1719_026991 [Acacia pycnantha]